MCVYACIYIFRGALELLLRHINTYSILEVLLKVVQEAEEAGSGGPSEEGGWAGWLVKQDIVPQLLAKFDSSDSAQVHENVSSALSWMLWQHGQMQWASTPTQRAAPLAKRLMEPDMVSSLLDKCLMGQGSAAERHPPPTPLFFF